MVSASSSRASNASCSLSRADKTEVWQEPGRWPYIQLDMAVDKAQRAHVGRPTGFCGTLITVPSRKRAKQWKIADGGIPGDGERAEHLFKPPYGTFLTDRHPRSNQH